MPDNQVAILTFIVEYKRSHQGNSPSNREIGEGCGISSSSTVDYFLRKLQADGAITLPGHKKVARQIEIVGAKWVLE